MQIGETQQHEGKTNSKSSNNVRLKNTPITSSLLLWLQDNSFDHVLQTLTLEYVCECYCGFDYIDFVY